MIGEYVTYQGQLYRIEDEWFGDVVISSKRFPSLVVKLKDLQPVHLQVVREKKSLKNGN